MTVFRSSVFSCVLYVFVHSFPVLIGLIAFLYSGLRLFDSCLVFEFRLAILGLLSVFLSISVLLIVAAGF
jgi:hypothetical protein